MGEQPPIDKAATPSYVSINRFIRSPAAARVSPEGQDSWHIPQAPGQRAHAWLLLEGRFLPMILRSLRICRVAATLMPALQGFSA